MPELCQERSDLTREQTSAKIDALEIGAIQQLQVGARAEAEVAHVHLVAVRDEQTLGARDLDVFRELQRGHRGLEGFLIRFLDGLAVERIESDAAHGSYHRANKVRKLCQGRGAQLLFSGCFLLLCEMLCRVVLRLIAIERCCLQIVDVIVA